MDTLTIMELSGFFSALLGIYIFVHGRISRAAKRQLEEELEKERDNNEMAKILLSLEEHGRVLRQLEDTLKHPDDSGFGVVWLKAEIDRISQLTQEVRNHLLGEQ